MADKSAILVVEDNDFVRMQIKQFLQTDGYNVLEATSAAEGVDFVKSQNDIGCALVDIRMEPEDGFDFLKKLQALEIKIPCILVTGDNNADILSKASAMGVVSVLMKPINKDRLLKMVERAIA
jgi:CheY-like chemotaxis protein